MVYSAGRFVLCLILCFFCSCVFQSFLNCDYLAWERERAINLSAFCTFVRLVLVGFVGFLLVSEKGCGL